MPGASREFVFESVLTGAAQSVLRAPKSQRISAYSLAMLLTDELKLCLHLEVALATESPLTVESREELVYLLGEACELEHGLMCEYLYAQFSLKRGVEEGLTPGQLVRVQAWEAALIDVIKQEMLHLALATNILTAVGAAPHFERPNFPDLVSVVSLRGADRTPALRGTSTAAFHVSRAS